MRVVSIASLVIALAVGTAVTYFHFPRAPLPITPDKLSMLEKAKSSTVMVITVFNPKYPDFVSTGSGAIISEDGYIVTNHHVIDNGEDFYVVLNEHDLYEAELVGHFEDADLALLKIEKEDLPYFEFNHEPLQAGQNVYAIGSPFALEQSISAGVLSALKRYSPHTPMTYYLQSNVACNPGNSGGPLVNEQGKLLGINSWVISHGIEEDSVPNPSLCFSVPDRVVEYVMARLKDGEKFKEKWVGATFKNVDYNISLKAGFNKVVGVMTNFVYPKSPAESAGLQRGDIIIDFNGEEINSVEELNAEVNLVPIDEPVPVVVWRKDEVIQMNMASEYMFPDDDEKSDKTADTDEAAKGSEAEAATESDGDVEAAPDDSSVEKAPEEGAEEDITPKAAAHTPNDDGEVADTQVEEDKEETEE